MYCSDCGVELEKGARFCQNCGKSVASMVATPSGESSSGKTFVAATQASPRKGPRAGAAAIAIGALCVVLVAVITIVALPALLGPSSSSASSSATASAAGASASAKQESVSADSDAKSKSSSSASASDGAKSNASSKGFVQADAEAKAREKAQAAGMQVLTGTLHMTTYGERAAEVNPKLASDFASVADEPLALLVFGVVQPLSAASAGDEGRVQTRAGQESISLGEPYQWADFDGQLITVAAFPQDLTFPSDVVGALYSAGGNAVLISPLTEQRAADLVFEPMGSSWLPSIEPSRVKEKESSATASSAAPNADYLLPDSATREYANDELLKMSDYELFIARNEIYARHGREFQSDELKSYFGAKSWYKGTTPSASFDESVLNEAERANIEHMLEIEQKRGSKYV